MIVAGSASPLLLSSAGGYNLTNSLRFRSSASAYLSRTFATGNRRTFTWSGWLKRGSLTGNQALMSPYTNGTGSGTYGVFRFVDGSIEFLDYTNGTYNAYFYTSSSQYTFRDPSAWYHIVLAVDTTQATGSDRIKIYVNGTQITGTFYATPTLNYDLQWNNNLVNYIGYTPSGSQYFDGYLTETNFIDGLALTPSSFGQTSTTTGVWIPKKYSGTYGTNGFYLPFTDNSALTTSSNVGLGKDFSGNANYWTTNNISITTGSTYDSMTDVPTLTSATTANYAVLNPLTAWRTVKPSNGNLSASGTSNFFATGTMTLASSKWYCEVQILGGTNEHNIGFVNLNSALLSSFPSSSTIRGSNAFSLYSFDGKFYDNGTASASLATFAANDIVMFAYDADNSKIYVGRNGTWLNSAVPASGTGAVSTTATAPLIVAGQYDYGNATGQEWNFGQRPFSYTPPTGFVALNTFNLPTPTIGATASSQANKYMDATLYTGNGTTQSITNSGSMQPDWVWIKSRSLAYAHNLGDSVRGVNNTLSSNSTGAENYAGAGDITAFNTNGFSIRQTSNWELSSSGATYIAWQWRASNATAVTNTAGTITSTVSASTTAGFSIVTYTGTGVTGTLGHGLGVAPAMIIVKSRSNASNWYTYHQSIGNTGAVALNLTDATITSANFWNNTSPTSTVFTASAGSAEINGNGLTYVAYCFAQVAGYSAFGSYAGNGSTDGTFVFTGFRPRFVMLKIFSGNTANWLIIDSARNTYNVVNLGLNPDASDAEFTSTVMDFTSNGFKLRSSAVSFNGSGCNYIYMAFAENPFKYANAR